MGPRLWLALGAAAWAAPALAPIAPPVATALGLRRRLGGDSPDDRVWLTFDDGPHPQGTPGVLEALARHDARATFFCVGEQAERYPSLCDEIAAAGHAIALHGQRHRCQLRLTPREVADDLDRGAETLTRLTGTAPATYRPPYGIFSPAGLHAARQRGFDTLLWSRWGHDWRRRITPVAIAAEATEDLRGGDVILLHDADHYNAADSWRRTVAALPAICDRIEALGLRSDTITRRCLSG
jgi:peptidoglycan/xylan/chitin deacetylase (PgdA/CDA1 family)